MPKPKKALTPMVLDSKDRVMVGDQELKPSWLEGFRLFTEGVKLRHIAKKLGYAEITVQKWKYQPWWKELTRIFFDNANEELRAGIVKRDGKLVKFYDKLLTGKLADDKSAGPAVKAMANRMEMGVNPLINRKGSIHVDTMINNTGPMVVNREATKGLSQEDLMKIITGEMEFPDHQESDGP